MDRPSRRCVVIVDDNEITRAGCAELLGAHPAIEVVDAVGHEAALRWTTEWDRVDVALVDAAAEREEGDQFPGVGVVRTIRARRSMAETLVVVLTGHLLDDALRRRMREVGADFFYSRTEAMTGDELAAVVLSPDEARRTRPESEDALRSLGITSRSRVDEFLLAVEADGLTNILAEDAAKKQGPMSTRSRWWTTVRTRLADAGRFEAVNNDGTAPRRDQSVPSLTQLRRIYTWATKVKPPR